MGACKHKFPPPKTAIKELTKSAGYWLSVYFLMLLFYSQQSNTPPECRGQWPEGNFKKAQSDIKWIYCLQTGFTAHKKWATGIVFANKSDYKIRLILGEDIWIELIREDVYFILQLCINSVTPAVFIYESMHEMMLLVRLNQTNSALTVQPWQRKKRWSSMSLCCYLALDPTEGAVRP